MRNELRIAAVAWMIAGPGRAQEPAAPALEFEPVVTENPQEASPTDTPTLAGGFSAKLDFQTQDEKLSEAYALLDGFEYQKAREIFETVLESLPGNNRALVGLSIIHTKNYQFGEALKILEYLMERDPKNVAIKNNAAWIYATADDPEIRNGHRAVELARDALVNAPGSYHIWSTMAEGYYTIGQFKKARDAATEAMRMAVQRKANSDNLREYRSQVTKCRLAVLALSLNE